MGARLPEGHFEPLRRTKLTSDDEGEEEEEEEEVKTRPPFGPSLPLFTHTYVHVAGQKQFNRVSCVVLSW